MASVGVRDKDGQILEFYSLNKAVMRIEREGFRTFIRIDGGPVYEPFRRTEDEGISQTMTVSSAELVLRERNERLGIEIDVAYFALPNLAVAAMARQVRLRNLAARRRRFEWLDGAARIIPFGVGLQRSKAIPRHIEAMMACGTCGASHCSDSNRSLGTWPRSPASQGDTSTWQLAPAWVAALSSTQMRCSGTR